MGDQKSKTELEKELRAAPGINVPDLPPGTVILIETPAQVYELIIVGNSHVIVTGTDHRFHTPVTGRFVQSVYDRDATISFAGWIGANLRMDIEFKNATFRSTPVISACVQGNGFKYDVFRIISESAGPSVWTDDVEGTTPGAED